MNTSGNGNLAVRRADSGDAHAVARLLYDFNREFDQPTPVASVLAKRVRRLIEAGDTTVLLVGSGPDGLVMLRYRPAIWTEALECWLAELYVIPPRRRRGLGRALMEAAIADARQRGADRMELATSDDDAAARALYEKFGFTNEADGSVNYFYERELP